VHAWSNGGFSSDQNNPNYGTHDFIAEHALDYVQADTRQWIQTNLKLYLYGTELPDNKNAPLGDGIGDTGNHHVYYYASGKLQDNASARRAQQAYDQVLKFLSVKNYSAAAKWMGVTTHYVDDLAVFGHVMGKETDWGPETHHEDYEEWANSRSDRYEDTFTVCLTFKGNEFISAYDAALTLAHDTTFDDTGKGHTAKWMDTNYNPLDSVFQARVCESINNAVNLLASLIYSAAKTTNIQEIILPIPVVLVALLISLVAIRGHWRRHQGASLST
jgi:hypothetical protein